ncbi:MAG: hypothetical protein AAF502_04070 [Bacteroidota bacterium]
MLQLFRTNSPLAAILVALYAVLLNLQAFLFPQVWEGSSSGLFSQLILDFIPEKTVWDTIAALAFIVIQALLVNALVNRFKITRNVTYFPAVFYVFAVSVIKDAVVLSPILMALTFYIIALFELFSIYKSRSSMGSIFNVGFWLAIGSLFYLSIGVYLLLGIMGIAMLIQLRFREIIVLVIGFLTPYLLLCTYFFWVDSLNSFWTTQILPNYGFLDFDIQNNWRVWVKVIFSGFIIMLSFVNIQGLLSKTKIQIQKYIWLLFWSIPVAALSIFMQAGVQTEHLIIICVPISVFLCLHFLNIRNKPISEFLHLFLLMLYFGFQYWEIILG